MYSHYNMHTLLKWRITKKISYWHCSKYLRARSNMIRQTYIPSRCRFQRSNIVSPQLKAFQGYNENTSNDNKDCCSRSTKSLRNCWLFPKKTWCFIKKLSMPPPATDTATATNVQRYQAPAFSPTGRCSDHCASKGMAGFDWGVVKVWQNVFLSIYKKW